MMPSTGYGSNEKTNHMLPSGFQKFPLHNVKELEMLLCATNLTVQRSVTVSPPRTAEPLWKGHPSWPSKSAIPMPSCAVKKMKRQLCTCHICVNKTIKLPKITHFLSLSSFYQTNRWRAKAFQTKKGIEMELV